MADILTFLRVICGLLILIFPAFSGWYYFLYLLGGFSDAIDGTVARKLGTESSFGAKLDTVADIVFAIAVVVKILTAVPVPAFLLVWICVIIFMKIANLLIGFIRYKRFVSVHSLLNKVCGIICFLVPLILGGANAWRVKSAALLCACLLAGAAAVHEGIIIYKGKATE